MSDNEYFAYIAGIFDGEGSVTLIQTSNTSSWRAPRISIPQKNQRAFLEELATRWGGFIQLNPSADRWRLDNPTLVKKFLADISPWLRFKRNKAVVAIALCDYCFGPSRHLTDREKLSRTILEDKFDEVNQKGRVV